MNNVIIIAVRNLFRYKRRTFLTSSLIAFGVILVIVFGGLAMAFKNQMIGTLTNTALGDLQIHKKGYVESIDNLPLNITLSGETLAGVETSLQENSAVAAYSLRVKFGAMISNYAQTSNIRLSAVYPEMENQTCPGLVGRIKGDVPEPDKFLKPGELLVPDNLMKGLGLNVGDEIVLVATNKDGSVNGLPLRIGAVIESVLGPGGKDGYMHMDDAKALLRMDETEIVEIAVHLEDFGQLSAVSSELKRTMLSDEAGIELHTWEQLSPFASIARIVDLLIFMVRFILISIVLVSILNIMTMSVYERISEIGTLAAMGTRPARILFMFLAEGFAMGILSTATGVVIGLGSLWLMTLTPIVFTFGMMQVTLTPDLPIQEVILVTAIVMFVSVFAGLQPAYKASQMEPVDALGHV